VRPFAALVWADLRVLGRSGYLWATVAVFLILLALALQVRRLDFAGFANVVTAVILLDVVVMPVLIVGLTVLLERGEGTMLGLAVTPVSPRTCLAARVTTVTLICAAEMLLLVMLSYDGGLEPVYLGGGLLSIAAVSCLAGYCTVIRATNVYAFIPPMMAVVLILGVPAYAVLAGSSAHWVAWHPTAPGLTLLEGAFAPLPAWRLAYGAIGSIVWLVLGGWLAMRSLMAIRARAAGA
jgi:fluoroquinolone transport system permease protein